MIVLAGVVALGEAAIDPDLEPRLKHAVGSPQSLLTTIAVEGALFVQAAPAGRRIPHADSVIRRDGRELFAAVARLDNREELGDALGLASRELPGESDAVLIRRMYERWGDAGLARCVGAFAYASWDARARRLTLARDCLGHRPLFFHRGPRWVVFATTLRALFALPDVPRAIDEIELANFLALNHAAEHRTFYRGVDRVPSRTLVTIDAEGVRHRKYWWPNLDAPPWTREEDYVERARELFDIAVASATRDTPHVTIATTGGLDSSAIAATVARLGRADSISCVTLVPPPDLANDVEPGRYRNERPKVEALGRMHPSLRLRFIVDDRLHPRDDDGTRVFAGTGLPLLGPTARSEALYLGDATTGGGARVLQLGSYGNVGLTWDGSFSLEALLRGHQWRGFLRELRATAREGGRGLARTFAGDVVMPVAPPWMRRAIHRLRGRDPDSVARTSALNPAFVAEAGLVRRWREQGFDPWGPWAGRDGTQLRAWHMFDQSQYRRDMRALVDQVNGFEVRAPHADRRLLEFVLSVPEPMFRRDGVPRSFARKVLADRLPREIVDERRRGANGAAWYRTLGERRAEMAIDLERLEGSPLARRLIDLPRLKRLMTQWPKDEDAAQSHKHEYEVILTRGIHVGRFIRWVEGGNG
jgi:asparagine synthase (glutamine-hydrolysing)